MPWKIRLEDPPEKFSDYIEIHESKPNWNDFGFNYHAEARFMYEENWISIDIFLIPLNTKGDIKPFSYLSQAPHLELFFYASILTTPNTYKELALALDSEDYKYLLSSLHDLSYDSHLGLDRAANFINTESFRLGILRYPQAYLSLIQGYENSYTNTPTQDAKVPFTLSTLLPGTENFVNLSVDYRHHEHFDDRIHCLIGVNGSGKTNLLTSLISAAAKSCDQNRDANTPKSKLYANEKEHTDTNDSSITFEKDFAFKRVVTYYSDPSSTLPKSANIGCFEYNSFNTTTNTQSDNFHHNISYLLVTLLRTDDSHLPLSNWNILLDSLYPILPMMLLALPVTENCPDNFCIRDSSGKKWSHINGMENEQRSLVILGAIDVEREPSFITKTTQNIISLSSGQRSFFRFALHFLTHAGFGTLLIIDEPETYLHPNLVTDYMMLLYKILQKTSSTALIATHSAYVVREVPTHCVHILSREKKIASIKKTYLQTLGASVSEISSNVFGDSTVDAYHRQISEKIASTGMPFGEIVENYKDIFNIEMLMEIKDRIANPLDYK